MKAIVINDSDSVGVALEDIKAGETAAGVTLLEDIPQGHKFALADIAAGAPVLKYGWPIGSAICDIRTGAHAHTHNVRTNLKGAVSYSYNPVNAAAPRDINANLPGTGKLPPDAVNAPETGRAGAPGKYFMGYVRESGEVGVRNEIWIIPTVGCVNKTAERLAEISRRRYPETYAFTHPFGCSQLEEDQSRTQALLACLVNHPNAGGVLVLGLGCENNHIGEFQKALIRQKKNCEKTFGGRVRFLNAQDSPDEIREGGEILNDLAAMAESLPRSRVPLSALRIGLKCGGSDGLSGITANPLTGAVSDMVINAGGSAILTEVPEMFGAEHLLMNRCADRELFDKTVGLINDFKNYYLSRGFNIYENPSPGNKAGGITTLEDKSLGCTQKGGASAVREILRYGESAREKGLALLEGPGNDLVAITGLTCAGAQIILFTTGRGTPAGAPVPTLKISSNTRLASQKPGWIDFDAGRLVTGESLEPLANELLSDIIALASGETAAKNETGGYREISLFKDGVIL